MPEPLFKRLSQLQFILALNAANHKAAQQHRNGPSNTVTALL